MNVLIADDNADDRRLLRHNAEKHGCRLVIEARDGQEGLELAKKHKPDLIVSDALMPRKDGFQFLRDIKADAELRAIPFIFYSAVYTGSKEQELARALGAEAFIVKPQTPEELWKTITALLQQRQTPAGQLPAPELMETEEVFLKKYSEMVAITLKEKTRALEETLAQREKAEEALRRLNRELRAISNCNQVLVRAIDEQELLHDICHIIADEAGYHLAWVGYAENDAAKTVRPVAWAGHEDGYLTNINITWADTERGRGPTGTTIRSGTTTYIQDFATDPRIAPWRAVALTHGHRSSIALPLKDESARTFGALTIYSTEANAFTADEIRLLEELAGDLAFGICVLRARIARRQAEAEHARLATVIEQAAETIVITDLNASILYANPAFERITGYTRQEALGQNPRILQSGRHDTAFYQQMWDTLKRGEVWHGHFVNKRKDGTFYEEDALISPIRDATGTIINYAAVKRDVTHEVQLEQQIQQSQKMEAVGRLAGGVAHDFNNILQAILGFCEIVLTDMPQQDEHRADLLEIQKSALRAADLTRQLLAFSRRQMITPTVLNLNALITNTDKMLGRLIGEDIQLVTHLAPDLKRVRADAGQLEQVVMNLAVNARDAMPQGGRLAISTANVTFEKQDLAVIPEAQPGDFICLAVADTGTGMTKEVMTHIFEPFFSTKGVGKGTGLGLAVIYGIVKQHNGWIHAYSQVGQGSTFTIYLPAYTDSSQPQFIPPAAALPPPIGRGEHILLVEDEIEVRSLAIRILQSAGYKVTAAENAENAEQIFKREADRFDAMFSDVVLPGHSGIELAKKLRLQKPTLAVLLSSGYTDERARWTAIEEEGFHFLQKPYPAAALLRAIRQVLDARTASA